MSDNYARQVHVEVTGWNADNESVAWDGYGDTEDEAVEDAKRRGGIVEIGDVTVVRRYTPDFFPADRFAS